jgi:formate-dependent nitrite reductase membrane component NrfD
MSEQRQVPQAEFGSYYGRPILKVSRWREPHLPAYLFLGELSGAAAMLAAAAAATNRRALARGVRLVAAGSAFGGAGFLTAELGRPERFLHMLRVAKPTSPMSMGTWILSAHSGLISAAVASDLTGLLPRTGAAAGAAAAVTGPLLAAYPGVLFANTAVPAWHEAYRQLPLFFVGGAMTAAAAAGLAAGSWGAAREQAGPARRLAVLGMLTETVAGFGLERMLGTSGEPYTRGDAGRLLRVGRALTIGGAAAALAARRSRLASVAAAAMLAAGGSCAKVAVLRAGKVSAADPRYLVEAQRRGAASSSDGFAGG